MDKKNSIREDDTLFKKIFQNTLDGILLADPQTQKFLICNHSICQMLRYSEEELLDLGFDDIHPKDELPHILKFYKKQTVGKMKIGDSIPVKRKDGIIFYADISTETIRIRNRPYMINIVRDVTKRKETEETLQYRTQFERLITSTSTELINLAPEKIDNGINLALQAIGEFANIDRSYVFLFNDDETKMDNTHEWCAKGIKPQIDQLRNLPMDIFHWSTERLKRSEIIHIPCVADMGPEASAEKEEFQAENIQSLILVPMVYGSHVVGFLGFDSVRKEKTWPESMIILLKMVGEIFANALQRKITEETLRESQERYRAIFVQASDSIVLVDAEKGVLVEFNDRAHENLGYTRKEFEKLKISDFEIIESVEEVKKHLRKIVKKGADTFETKHRTKNGDVRDILVSSRAISIHGRNFIQSIWYDITERKRAEEELKIRDRAIASSLTAMAIAEFAGNLTYVNDSYLKMLGYEDKSEVLGRPAVDFWHEPEKALEIIEALRRGESWIGEMRGKKKDGSLFYVQLSASMVVDMNGKPISMMASFIDITERKKAEDQIQKDLKEKEVLLKEIYHRVKNNLNVIISLLNLQASKIKTKEQVLDAFKESKDRIYAMALVHEKLYKSKDLYNIDMRSYIETMVQELFHVYDVDKQVKLDLNIEDVYLNINIAIPYGLILNELVTNALKHAFPNRMKGIMRILFNIKKKKTYELIVDDNGIGLPRHIDILKSESLGLQLVRILVDQIDGNLRISRKEGTRFTITCPVNIP